MAEQTIILDKSQIKRDDLKNSLLKQVIIRLDFSSMINLDGFIDKLAKEDWFKGSFQTYNKILSPKESKTSDARTSSNNGDNVNDVRIFSKYIKGPEKDTYLSLTDQSICVEIKCDKNYEKIDPYVSLVSKVWDLLENQDQYVNLIRIGIRKIDGFDANDGKEADHIFEYFDQKCCDISKDTLFDRTYTDTFIRNPERVEVIYTRKVTIQSNPLGDKNRFIFVLDIDTFVTDRLIMEMKDISNPRRPTEKEIESLMMEKINSVSFDMYKTGIKVGYLLNDKK